MSYSEYYTKREDGSYLVHFGNYYGFTPEEIRDAFQVYGKVLTVDTRGQVRGLCFVRLLTENDAIECVKGFKTSKSIRILKHKKHGSQRSATPDPQPNAGIKQVIPQLLDNSFTQESLDTKKSMTKFKALQDISKSQNENKKAQYSMLNTSKQSTSSEHVMPKLLDISFTQESLITKVKVETNKSQSKIAAQQSTTKNNNENGKSPDTDLNIPLHSTSVYKNRQDQKPKKNKQLTELKAMQGQKQKKNHRKEKDASSNGTEAGRLSLLQQENPNMDWAMYRKCMAALSSNSLNASSRSLMYTKCPTASSTHSLNGNTNIDMHTKCLASSSTLSLNPALKFHTKETDTRVAEEAIVANISTLKSDTEATDTCVAKEVIVANISDTYGIHYILHLFEKHNPIAISMMKTIQYSKIRYCHVYFTSLEDAMATQLEFDNYILEEKGLIVLQSQTLFHQTQGK